MKKLFSLFLIGFTVFAFAQGKSISLLKKITEPITISDSIKLSVDDEIKLTLGTNIDGSFKFVQMLNNFNEPIKPADSRASMMKQKIKFFKEQDGVYYVFTKYFVINIEAALMSKEVELVKKN